MCIRPYMTYPPTWLVVTYQEMSPNCANDHDVVLSSCATVYKDEEKERQRRLIDLESIISLLQCRPRTTTRTHFIIMIIILFFVVVAFHLYHHSIICVKHAYNNNVYNNIKCIPLWMRTDTYNHHTACGMWRIAASQNVD